MDPPAGKGAHALHRVVDAAAESRQPVAAEWRCSEGAGGNPLVHYSSDLCPLIYNNFWCLLADIPVNSGADDPADVIAQSVDLDWFFSPPFFSLTV